ncbi:MAG: DUF4249 domain-containing protein [Bacteroidia bacterium]
MKKLFYFPVLLILLVFTSCEDVVQIKLDEGSKIYVVDAFVNDLRQDQSIRISTNDSYFSNRVAPGVTNASVVLTDLTDNVTYTFNHTNNGYYVYPITANDTIGKINHSYLLTVTIDGYPYTAQSQLKRTAIIDSIGTVYNDGSAGAFGGTKDTYNCFLYARDIADNNPDYYWIKTFRNDTLFGGPSDISVSIDGTNGAVVDAPTPFIDFTPPGNFLGFKEYRKFNTCKVEIHSISKLTYNFFVQAQQQINNGGLFATTPENIKTNINTPDGAAHKSIGWFSMASVASFSRVVQ